MAERLALIDYGCGNLRSVAKALERAATDSGLAVAIDVTSNAKSIAAADRIVLPGVGAFGHCAASLRALPDVWDVLGTRVRTQAKPFLGICVGMQLMATCGLEHGEHTGLNWISGDVILLAPDDATLKVPHMGWNSLTPVRDHAVLRGLPENGMAYFVHSYIFNVVDKSDVCLMTDYGQAITAMVARDTMIGTQFHPEKSQGFGLAFLQNFLRWKP